MQLPSDTTCLPRKRWYTKGLVRVGSDRDARSKFGRWPRGRKCLLRAGTTNHERRHSPQVRQVHRDLRLWRNLGNAEHDPRDQGGNLLVLPPVLHGYAENGGLTRPGGSLHQKVRRRVLQEGNEEVSHHEAILGLASPALTTGTRIDRTGSDDARAFLFPRIATIFSAARAIGVTVRSWHATEFVTLSLVRRCKVPRRHVQRRQ